jgi:hypothetical protein
MQVKGMAEKGFFYELVSPKVYFKNYFASWVISV